jgi:hypothetical protein
VGLSPACHRVAAITEVLTVLPVSLLPIFQLFDQPPGSPRRASPGQGRGFFTRILRVSHHPVSAGLVAHAEDWPRSSVRAHLAGREDALVKGTSSPRSDAFFCRAS